MPVSDNVNYNTPTCFQNNGSSDSPVTTQSVIPDLSVFQACIAAPHLATPAITFLFLAQNASSLAWVRGELCENWVYNFTYGTQVLHRSGCCYDFILLF